MITSLDRLVGPVTSLVVLADEGLLQIRRIRPDQADREFAAWKLIPLEDGRCRIANVGLGDELVLSVTDFRERTDGSRIYTIEMAAVDPALSQDWVITRVGDPPGDFDRRCGELPR